MISFPTYFYKNQYQSVYSVIFLYFKCFLFWRTTHM